MDIKQAIRLVDPDTRKDELDAIRGTGYQGITGDMGACMALDDACREVCSQLRQGNDPVPLTYDELLSRDKKPVWTKSPSGAFSPEWMIVCVEAGEAQTALCSLPFDSYGYDDGWLAFDFET